MNKYTLTVGLEVHAELATKTKMFCDSPNSSTSLGASRPNTLVCPVCMGYPGTLPVINKEAVRSILRLGVAVDGRLSDFSEFDRKNYFYPDIPKGYQISQYKHPLVEGGELSGIKLTRIHLEEDTAKSLHNSSVSQVDKFSLVDFNRAGVPLMELVTEPVIRTSEEAVNFAKELQLLLRYLGVSEANMEKGEMRVEANISVSSTETFGTKVEVKNINSFSAVGKAIEYEFSRQVELLEKGEKVVQETRGWNENTRETFSQRLKESAHDYRYFPEPDLPKLFINEISEFSKTELKKSLPELPWEKRERLMKLDISREHAEIYVSQPEWGNYFEELAACLGDVRLVSLASNYITTDLKKFIPTESLAELIRMVSKGEISSRGAKDILSIIQEKGGEPKQIAEHNNLFQKSDMEELKTIAEKIIEENTNAVKEYKKGKLSSLQFLVGQAMKETKGSANPQVIKNIFEELLK